MRLNQDLRRIDGVTDGRAAECWGPKARASWTIGYGRPIQMRTVSARGMCREASWRCSTTSSLPRASGGRGAHAVKQDKLTSSRIYTGPNSSRARSGTWPACSLPPLPSIWIRNVLTRCRWAAKCVCSFCPGHAACEFSPVLRHSRQMLDQRALQPSAIRKRPRRTSFAVRSCGPRCFKVCSKRLHCSLSCSTCVHCMSTMHRPRPAGCAVESALWLVGRRSERATSTRQACGLGLADRDENGFGLVSRAQHVFRRSGPYLPTTPNSLQ